MTLSPTVALKGGSITFDGSNSYLIGDGADSSNLMYQWSCEPPFTDFCETSSLSNDQNSLTISGLIFDAVEAEYNTQYDVTLYVLWVDPLGLEVSSKDTQTFYFIDLEKPDFEIVSENKILATADYDQVYSLNLFNYAEEDMSNFNINWIISPEIPGGQSSGIQYNIPPLSLKTSTVYIISV